MSYVQIVVDASSATAALDALPRGAVRRAVIGSVREATRPMLRSAKDYAKKAFRDRTGLLRRSLSLKRAKRTGDAIKFYVGPNRKTVGMRKGKKVWPVKYAHLVELGHRIATGGRGQLSKKGVTLAHKRTGRQYGKQQAFYAGDVAPRPFLTPAFEENKGAAQRRFAIEFQRMLPREVAREATVAAHRGKS